MAAIGKINLRRFIWWLTYAVWAGMLVALFTGALEETRGGLQAPEELLKGVHLAPEVTWMGVYLNGGKIGYIRSELAPLRGGGYRITESSDLTSSMMGAAQNIHLEMAVVTDSTLALVMFFGSLDAAGMRTEYSGKVEGDVLRIKLDTGGGAQERFIPAPEPLYVSQAIKPLLQAGRLGAGDLLKLSGFDPVSMQMQDLVIYGADPASYTLFGRDYTARKLVSKLAGFESTIYVDESGNTVVEYGPMGMVMRAESEEMATRIEMDKPRVDILQTFAVSPGGKRIEIPRNVTAAKYRIYGATLDMLMSSWRQVPLAGAGGEIDLSVDANRRPPGDQIEFPAQDSPYLKDAPFIESRNPRIKEAAAAAVKGAFSRADTLDRLSEWVFKNVQKRMSGGIPSALAVLNNPRGDCNEHSVLFTALARSLGIPTRIQLGLVYQEGKFYYHAWPSAWVDGRWEEFEPTFGLKRADAARISLAVGDMSNAVELVGAVGNIQIEVLETR